MAVSIPEALEVATPQPSPPKSSSKHTAGSARKPAAATRRTLTPDLPDARWRLEGKRAVVTGASSGIGAEIAASLAAAGADLLLIGRDRLRLDETAGRVRATGRGADVLPLDLTAGSAPDAVARRSNQLFGSVDILVHSAGVYERRPFAETSLEILDAHWRTNARAPFALTQALLPHLASGASIILLSSVAARAGIRNASAYAMSKAAVNALTSVLAVELAPRGIRVNAVAPGFTETPMNAALRENEEIVRFTIDVTPAGRIGTVDDIAPAVVFLASDAARFVQGIVLPVDGGYPTPFAAPRTPTD